MLQINFEYPIRGINLQVVAACRSVLNGEYVEGLTLTFLNEDDVRIHVPYNKDIFDDIESEAIYYLAEAYYNPELNFGSH